MPKALVIVESPTKVKTINKILGEKYKVVSSMGHLIDLPRSTFGVDIEHEFSPKFIIVKEKQKILSQLKMDKKYRDLIGTSLLKLFQHSQNIAGQYKV